MIVIEFDHLLGIIFDDREPSQRYAHTIVRSPNDNDYGRSFLLENCRRQVHSHVEARAIDELLVTA